MLIALPPNSAVPPGFLPKRGLNLNLRRALCSTIKVVAKQHSAEAGLSEQFARLLQAEQQPQHVWFQSCTQIKGVPPGLS